MLLPESWTPGMFSTNAVGVNSSSTRTTTACFTPPLHFTFLMLRDAICTRNTHDAPLYRWGMTYHHLCIWTASDDLCASGALPLPCTFPALHRTTLTMISDANFNWRFLLTTMTCDTKLSLNPMGIQLHCNKKNILQKISMYVRIIMFYKIIRLCIPRKKKHRHDSIVSKQWCRLYIPLPNYEHLESHPRSQ